MIHHIINKKDELITYHTIIKVLDQYVSLSITKLLGYLKPSDLKNPEFKDIFYWDEEQLINPKLNHLSFNAIKDSNSVYKYTNYNGNLLYVNSYLVIQCLLNYQ